MEGGDNLSNRTNSRLKEDEKNDNAAADVEVESRKVSQDQEEDTVYEGIRGHERHILSHFFTLFCISFVGGLVLIHLSLWLNVTCGVNIHGDKTTEQLKDDAFNISLDIVKEYTTIFTEDETLAPYFTSNFYYTGEYFMIVEGREHVSRFNSNEKT